MTNKTEHTALPWGVYKHGDAIHSAKGQVTITGFALSCGPRNREAEANTHYIVKAANYHYRLVEALKELVDVFPVTATEDEWSTLNDAENLITELEQQK